MGLCNPRKIGMGVPNILGFMGWENGGVDLFFLTLARNVSGTLFVTQDMLP